SWLSFSAWELSKRFYNCPIGRGLPTLSDTHLRVRWALSRLIPGGNSPPRGLALATSRTVPAFRLALALAMVCRSIVGNCEDFHFLPVADYCSSSHCSRCTDPL